MREIRPLIIQTAILAAVYVAALLLMPGAPPATTALAMTALMLGAQLAYGMTKAWTAGGRLILSITGGILGVGIIANVYYFTTVSGGTDAAPVLQNTDAARYWLTAVEFLDGRKVTVDPSYGMLGYIYGCVLWLTGRSVTVVLMLSMACTLVTLICSAVLARRLAESDKPHRSEADCRRIATIAMGATASVCYLMASGMIGIKDAWVIALTAMIACAVFVRPGRRVGIVLFTVCALLMAMIRANYLLAILGGLVLALVSQKISTRRLIFLGICAAVALTCWYAVTQTAYTPSVDYVTNCYQTAKPQQHMALYGIIGMRDDYPLWLRAALLPVTAVTQFLIPFPWNFSRDIIFGYSQIYAHIAYPWYIFGALFVYWLFTGARRASRTVICLVLWGLLLWLTPCLTWSMGTVSRYALPAVPLLSYPVAYVIDGYLRRRSLWIWMGIYAVAMTAVLIICHYLQMRTMN